MTNIREIAIQDKELIYSLGTPFFLRKLADILEQKEFWTGCGVDISEHCLHHAKRLLRKKNVFERCELSVGDVRALAYPDDTFDLVVAVEVLEHIPDPEAGLAEALRVLKVYDPGEVSQNVNPTGKLLNTWGLMKKAKASKL